MDSWLANGSIKRKRRQDIDSESTGDLPALKHTKKNRSEKIQCLVLSTGTYLDRLRR